MISPIYNQYSIAQVKYPSALVLIQVGNEYWTYDQNAYQLNKHCASASKPVKPAAPAIIPDTKLEDCIEKLLLVGYTVVVVTQVGEPNKRIIERKITRIETP